MKYIKIMSRLAKKPIKIPEGVTVKKENDFYIFRGPKGETKKTFPEGVEIKLDGSNILLSLKKEDGIPAAILGTAASLAKSAILGVVAPFEKKLEIEGVGYKAQLDGQNLSLSLGFTNPVKVVIPEGISVKLEKNVITLSGLDKEKVGSIAAQIRSQKPPEPYKGKGIHYAGEIIRRKAGKKAVAAA